MAIDDNSVENGENASLIPNKSVQPAPDTLTKLIARLRALTLTLLPVEVAPEDLDSPTSRIITPQVVSTYMAAAGDFVEALPYCLLRARTEFKWDANHDAADYDENNGRAIACEVLARRIVHKSASDRIPAIMSTRHRHRELDGDISEKCSVLELAIDTHCTIFLSSSESQGVVNDLWTGALVQQNNGHHEIDYVPYQRKSRHSFWESVDPSRLGVPRYQNIFRIVIWIFFLVVYSRAVREPLEKLDEKHLTIDEWEVVLYTMALSFLVEDTYRFFKLVRFVTWRAFNFWSGVSLLTNSLFLAAFVLRILGLFAHGSQIAEMRLRSFQVLSFVAPLIWIKIVTIFDGMKYMGTLQICVARMLQESGIFFALLFVLGLGFAQALYALDAADGQAEPSSAVANVLIQALLQAPDFTKFPGGETGLSAGLIMFYCWNVVTALILLNVLISLFASAYSDVVDDAEAQFLAFFAGKTVSMVRAPDSYVYPAPFNLLELVFVAPFESLGRFSMSEAKYAKLNRFVMRFFFFIPLVIISLYESTIQNPAHQAWMRSLLASDDQGRADSPEHRDPDVSPDDESNGMKITKVRFSELVKAFPDTTQSTEATIMKELTVVRRQLDELMKKLESLEK